MMGMNQNPHSLHFLICPFFLFRTIYSFLKRTKTPPPPKKKNNPRSQADPKQFPETSGTVDG